jgi:hypothetical protein
MSNEVNVTQISFTMKQAVSILSVVTALVAGAVGGYYGVIPRIDRLDDKVSNLDKATQEGFARIDKRFDTIEKLLQAKQP